MNTPFKEIQRYYDQRDLAAREWKAEGKKVVGYFCDNVPEELILAAGFFPYRISGDPAGGTEQAEKYRLTYTPVEFVDSMLNMLLIGQYDFLNYLIIPHARDQVYRLYQIIYHIKELNPDLLLPEIYFYDNLHTPFYVSGLYNRGRTFELKSKLEEWSGSPITDQALSQAIAIGNENRKLLKQVAALRAAEPSRISGVEALQIIGPSMFILKEEHNKLLAAFLDDAENLPARDGVRLFVEASPLDNLQLYELIESCQATVVAEDNCWGNRYSDVPVQMSSTPLEALVDRYHKKSPCPRMYPLSRRVDYCVQSALAAKAQGVVFFVYAEDSQTWEIPDQVKALDEKGVPHILFRMRPYRITEPDKLKAQIADFIESI